MQGRARREGKEGEGGRSVEEMAFTDYSEQRNVGQDSMHHARFAVAPLPPPTWHATNVVEIRNPTICPFGHVDKIVTDETV